MTPSSPSPLLLTALLGCALSGCDRLSGIGEALTPEDELLNASEEVIFESTKMLGPHKAEILKVTEYPDRRPVQEGMVLWWGNDDHFAIRRLRNGEVKSETRVVLGAPYSRSGSGRFRKGTDPEIHRGELAQTWTLWDRTLSPFGGRIVYTEAGDTVIEGRPAKRYTISLAPQTEAAGVQIPLAPSALSGEVVLDEGTATRLVVDIEGELLEGGRPDQTRRFTLQITRSNLGVFPDIEVPPRYRGRN